MSDDESVILEEEQALSGYFDALLGETSSQQEALVKKTDKLEEQAQENILEDKRPLVVVEPAIATPLPEPLGLEIGIEEIEIPETVVVEPLPVFDFPVPDVLEEIETNVIDGAELEKNTELAVEEDSAVPLWARQEFQCVSFMVQGLKLIVPLAGLSQVYALQEHKVKAIFGQADWFIGMMKPVDESVNVIDAAHWLLPETNQRGVVAQESPEYEFVLAFEGGAWGMACDDLGFSEFLKSDDINWHNKDPKRPWLAGVVIERMCGLLDPEQFVKFLNSKSRGLPVN